MLNRIEAIVSKAIAEREREKERKRDKEMRSKRFLLKQSRIIERESSYLGYHRDGAEAF